MTKEQEAWQFAGEGQWQTADRRFTILESQSGEYHHLVDNQRLRNSKTFKTFAECDEYAGQIRNGLEEPSPAKKTRRDEDEAAERGIRQAGVQNTERAAVQSKKQDGRTGRQTAAEERHSERAERGQGGGRRGRRQEKEHAKESARARNDGQKEGADSGRQQEKPPRRRRHHRRSGSAQTQTGPVLKE